MKLVLPLFCLTMLLSSAFCCRFENEIPPKFSNGGMWQARSLEVTHYDQTLSRIIDWSSKEYELGEKVIEFNEQTGAFTEFEYSKTISSGTYLDGGYPRRITLINGADSLIMHVMDISEKELVLQRQEITDEGQLIQVVNYER